MQVRRVPAATGWQWVMEGFTVFGRNPGAILGAAVLMIFALLVSSMPPLIGSLLPLVIWPALGYGFAQVSRKVLDGQKPAPLTLFTGLRPKAKTVFQGMLAIGSVNAAATALALLATLPIDGGALLEQLSPRAAADQAEPGIATAYAGLVFLALYCPLQLALWYSPLFVGMDGVPPARAFFYSVVAVWRNKFAFCVYFGGWLLVAIGLSILARLVALVLPSAIAGFVLAPGLLVAMVALYSGSFWATYRDTVEKDGYPSRPAAT
ncbi:MAG: BPSS1780 family membrane protein [Lautropia sp.]